METTTLNQIGHQKPCRHFPNDCEGCWQKCPLAQTFACNIKPLAA